MHFLRYENVSISFEVSLKFVLGRPFDNVLIFVQEMILRSTSDKPLRKTIPDSCSKDRHRLDFNLALSRWINI